jgi:flagellar basal-body rod protein FlgC
MISAVSIGLSGLAAADLRLNVAASNIANAQDVGVLPGTNGQSAYAPLQVMQSDTGPGTVAYTVPVNPPYIPTYDPQSPDANDQGLVAAPNVNLAQDLVQLQVARQAYEGNLKTVEAGLSTTNYLLGIA